MYDVKLSKEFEERLLGFDEDALAEVTILIELLMEAGIEVIFVLDRLYKELVLQSDPLGSIRWMAFRIYMDRQRVNILVRVEQNGSIVLY